MPISSPSTGLYALGRGVLMIAPFESSSFVDVGNCNKFELTVTEEKLEHFSYRSGLKTKDKVVILESGYEGSFTLDEISQANLIKYLKGSVVGRTLRANTVLDSEWTLQYTATNPVGEKQIFTFHRVKLTPGGNMALIGDEWLALEFSFEGLADAENNPDSPFFDVEWPTTTT